ncbi:hypothetical protein [Nostoc sp. T09]|uniref:hypothetical protein n=1 Tax=Nostoc sp. T09 TaxID=1932621 RepID=UPI0015C4FEE4|nr:hypothetical protein [Nostoc sp. T09]
MEFYRQLPLESNNLLQQLAQLSDEHLLRSLRFNIAVVTTTMRSLIHKNFLF